MHLIQLGNGFLVRHRAIGKVKIENANLDVVRPEVVQGLLYGLAETLRIMPSMSSRVDLRVDDKLLQIELGGNVLFVPSVGPFNDCESVRRQQKSDMLAHLAVSSSL